MTGKITSIVSYIVIMFITIFAGSYAISFLVQKSTTCDTEHISLCTTESICTSNNLYWWDNSCHTTKKPEQPICSKEYIHLCDTEKLCEEIGVYWWDNSCHTNEKPKPEPSEYPDYDSLPTMNNLVLVKDFRSYTPETEVLNKYTANGIILKSGKIAKGYLEIIASMKDKPLTIWESVYFKANYNAINYYEYGGHIFRPSSLKLPPSEKTHLLFPLNNIPFLPSIPYSEDKTPTTTLDFFNLINEKKETNFLAFISSLTPAKIDMIKIYYECDENANNGKCELILKSL